MHHLSHAAPEKEEREATQSTRDSVKTSAATEGAIKLIMWPLSPGAR